MRYLVAHCQPRQQGHPYAADSVTVVLQEGCRLCHDTGFDAAYVPRGGKQGMVEGFGTNDFRFTVSLL